MSFAYSPDALIYNSYSNTWSLRPDYDVTLHSVDIQISDNDAYVDGDWANYEVGDDANRTGQVYDLNGNLIASGKILDEEYYGLARPGGGTIRVERIEINGQFASYEGQFIGYVVSERLDPGVNYTQCESDNAETPLSSDGEDTHLAYGQIDCVPGFGHGLHLETDRGPIPVDWLAKGDRVLTLDHGYQPILWVGRSRVSARDIIENPELRPVLVPAKRFGADGPVSDMTLSPEHRVLISSPLVEHHIGTHEALAACKFLDNAPGNAALPEVGPDGFTYYHVLFAEHEIVRAEGLWVESLFSGDMALQAFDALAKRQVEAELQDFDDGSAMKTARYVLTERECVAMQLARWSVPGGHAEGARYGSKIA